MAKLTQGSKLYALLRNAGDTAYEVVAVDCITSFNPGGQPKDKIEATCLEETDARSYLPGLSTPAAASVGLNADPGNASHLRLYNEFASGSQDNIKWALGWSDGTAAPTVAVGGTDFVLPATRTWFAFEGFISDFPFDFQVNSIVQTQMTIERSGLGVWVPKA